jgi:hypothetical protein
MRAKPTMSATERFWLNVNRDGPIPAHRPDLGPCWLKDGPVTSRYGKFRFGKKDIPTHRFSWELHYGPIPSGLFVLHACDFKPCLRPTHLFLGTQADNMADKTSKGRQARGATHGSRLHPERFTGGTPPHYSGEAHSQAKLTAADIVTIRQRHANEGVGCRRLAREYGVHRDTIGNVLAGRTWATV